MTFLQTAAVNNYERKGSSLHFYSYEKYIRKIPE